MLIFSHLGNKRGFKESRLKSLGVDERRERWRELRIATTFVNKNVCKI